MFKSLYNSVRIFKNPTEKWASDLKQILTDLKGYMDSNAIIVRDSNTPLSSMNRSSRQKISMKTLALNDMLDQMNLTSIYTEYFTPKQQNTHSSQVHMEHSLEYIMCQTTKQVRNYIKHLFRPKQYEPRSQLQEEIWKKHNHMDIKQHATKKSQWANEEIKEEIRKYLETNEKNKKNLTTFQNL